LEHQDQILEDFGLVAVVVLKLHTADFHLFLVVLVAAAEVVDQVEHKYLEHQTLVEVVGLEELLYQVLHQQFRVMAVLV
jgi:hypothetical protein